MKWIGGVFLIQIFLHHKKKAKAVIVCQIRRIYIVIKVVQSR